MGHIRMHVKDSCHLITNRTEHEQYMLTPTPHVNGVIRYWLAKAKVLYGSGLNIFGFVFMSNHFHLFLQDTQGQIAEFMRYFQSGVATSINRSLKRKGRFWAREYNDVIVDGEADFWQLYDYINANPVKAGLVALPAQWGGVSSYAHSLDDTPVVGTGINLALYNDTKRYRPNVAPEAFEETYSFTLALPPAWATWSLDARADEIKSRTRQRCKKLTEERNGKPVLGMRRVRKTNPFDRPKRPKTGPRHLFCCMDKERLKALKEAYCRHVAAYKECIAVLFRCSDNLKMAAQLTWPPWSYPPTRHAPQGF